MPLPRSHQASGGDGANPLPTVHDAGGVLSPSGSHWAIVGCFLMGTACPCCLVARRSPPGLTGRYKPRVWRFGINLQDSSSCWSWVGERLKAQGLDFSFPIYSKNQNSLRHVDLV